MVNQCSLLRYITMLYIYIVLYSFQRIYTNFPSYHSFFIFLYHPYELDALIFISEIRKCSSILLPFLDKVLFYLVSQSCCQKGVFREYYLRVVFSEPSQGLYGILTNVLNKWSKKYKNTLYTGRLRHETYVYIHMHIYVCLCSGVILKILNNLNSKLALPLEVSEKDQVGGATWGGGWEIGYLLFRMEVFQDFNDHGCTGVYRLNDTLYVYASVLSGNKKWFCTVYRSWSRKSEEHRLRGQIPLAAQYRLFEGFSCSNVGLPHARRQF